MKEKPRFCRQIRILKEYTEWELNLYRCGVDIEDTPGSVLANEMFEILSNYDVEWAYDPVEDFNWILEFCGNCDFNTMYSDYKRAEIAWDLTDTRTLYDFIVYMNECEWKE